MAIRHWVKTRSEPTVTVFTTGTMLWASDTNYKMTFREETMDFCMLLAKTITRYQMLMVFYSSAATKILLLQMNLQISIDQME